MEALAARARRLPLLRGISDSLLLSLLACTDTAVDRVQSGVVLFSKGEYTSYWYLLLSGEIQLFLPKTRHQSSLHLRTLSSGNLFGELDSVRHCCSAIVTRAAEFVKISQNHFLGIYNKHADHLQPFIVVMQDAIAEEHVLSPQLPMLQHPLDMVSNVTNYVSPAAYSNPTTYNQPSTYSNPTTYNPQPSTYSNPARNGHGYHPTDNNGYHHEYQDPFNLAPLDAELPYVSDQPSTQFVDSNIFEFSQVSLEARMAEAGAILRHTMTNQAPQLIRERVMHGSSFSGCMVGSEMVDWLLELSISVGAHTPGQSRFQITGMWQTLLEHSVICHVTNEQQFTDKHLFYRWVGDSRQNGHAYLRDEPPTSEDITNAVFLLSTIGPDALFRMILGKLPQERTPEELELVYEELLHVKALSHLSTMVKRELANVIGYEHHTHAGTVLFHQGDAGNNWYIVLKGSVDVSIHGKGVVCSLQEGDDFGKLALVNDAPRAATIALREHNAQFLVVNKHDFNRIIRNVEENTVRLREHGQDVLVLEKMSLPRGAAVDDGGAATTSRGTCCYSVMAGLPEKMLEYVLETRVDAQEDGGKVDVFLEDFILTHIIYMPTNDLCNYLKNYYTRKTQVKHAPLDSVLPPLDDLCSELLVSAKRRVVSFVALWVDLLGLHYFLDPAANAFLEELYCHVLEDNRRLPGMANILHRMTLLRQRREDAMRTLARHPAVVLECGVLAAGAPAPQPVLPSDTCNQILHLSDTTSFALSIRMDKTAKEICELARNKLRYTQSNEPLCLVEVKSAGERIIYSPLDISIPTMLSLNGKLYIAYRDEADSLVAQQDQSGPSESVHSSSLEFVGSSELAQQLSLIHGQLFEACDEIELITHIVGREQFPGRVPSNLDLIIRRFNEVQYWATTEVLLAQPAKRVNTLRKFIKIAMYSKENRDLLSFFAITLGLSNIAVSRLALTWQRLPAKLRRQFAEFESLLDPSRNHRPYRALVAKMSPPLIPFVPLLMKDLAFVHEGNKTFYNGLVNFEKMHMIANILRSFRQCKARFSPPNYEMKNIYDTQNLLRNFRVIDNQRRLMELSYQIEPQKRRRNN